MHEFLALMQCCSTAAPQHHLPIKEGSCGHQTLPHQQAPPQRHMQVVGLLHPIPAAASAAGLAPAATARAAWRWPRQSTVAPDCRALAAGQRSSCTTSSQLGSFFCSGNPETIRAGTDLCPGVCSRIASHLNRGCNLSTTLYPFRFSADRSVGQ